MSWTLFIVYLGASMPPPPFQVSAYNARATCENEAVRINAQTTGYNSKPFAICIWR